jgi:hypothetical protein
MELLGMFLFLALVFVVLTVRSVHAGHGGVILWLVVLVGGLCYMLAMFHEPSLGASLFTWSWVLWLVLAPAVWTWRELRRRARGG